MNYYNDNNPEIAEWLRELIRDGHLPEGCVDQRSISEVTGAELAEFTQCHFFAGIGGWPYALRLAGWPEDRPVWTGSCPCQPFSQAGKRLGERDSRHVWPEFRRLIGERRPPVCFGEQVASADGRVWLAGVRLDLENLAYAVGGADLCAAGVTAPQLRQRLYWVGESDSHGRTARGEAAAPAGYGSAALATSGPNPPRLANNNDTGRQEQRRTEPDAPEHAAVERACQGFNGLSDALRLQTDEQRQEHGRPCQQQGRAVDARREALRPPQGAPGANHPDGHRALSHGLVNADGRHQHWWSGPIEVGWNCVEAEITRGSRKHCAQWRLKPGLSLLADGIPGRVAQIGGFGNAIVPQVAAEFIGAWLDCQ